MMLRRDWLKREAVRGWLLLAALILMEATRHA